jgi:hypothetical protein
MNPPESLYVGARDRNLRSFAIRASGWSLIIANLAAANTIHVHMIRTMPIIAKLRCNPPNVPDEVFPDSREFATDS